MKVTNVGITPTQSLVDAGNPSLTPELLAATGARYSRNNEGLEAIISKIDFNNTDKSVDSIFKMVDYGHASLMDLVPVALFIDDISILMAFILFYLCPTASGQESSTRYINYDDSKLYIANDELTNEHYQILFDNYKTSLEFWSKVGGDRPDLTGIPHNVTDKQRERMTRNFAFDRARIWLPMAACTNLMMIQSARSWCNLVSILLSHPFNEAQELATSILEQLELSAPRMIKHAVPKESNKMWMNGWLESWSHEVDNSYKPHVVFGSNMLDYKTLVDKELGARENRYGACGDTIRMTPVTYIIPAISFGEIRDLNRHRTGSKMLFLKPRGFYNTLDETINLDGIDCSPIKRLAEYGESLVKFYSSKDVETGLYALPLGTQFDWMHHTTLNHFIYQAELRTGLGSHYKYCKHMKDTLKEVYRKYPILENYIFEGQGEPE